MKGFFKSQEQTKTNKAKKKQAGNIFYTTFEHLVPLADGAGL